MENVMVCEDAGKIFGPESGLTTNPTVDEIRNAVNEWIKEFRGNVLNDTDALIERDKGTDREGMWRKLRAKYAVELEELSRDIAGLN